jgi:hypothetical protein
MLAVGPTAITGIAAVAEEARPPTSWRHPAAPGRPRGTRSGRILNGWMGGPAIRRTSTQELPRTPGADCLLKHTLAYRWTLLIVTSKGDRVPGMAGTLPMPKRGRRRRGWHPA